MFFSLFFYSFSFYFLMIFVFIFILILLKQVKCYGCRTFHFQHLKRLDIGLSSKFIFLQFRHHCWFSG